jgi:hypothetical protein
MDLLSTLDMFIEELEADLEEISGEIREETNFEDNTVDYLSDLYDDKQHHLENLKEIRRLLVSNNLVEENND